MVEKLKTLVGGRVHKNREALLQRLEGELDSIYDFIYQVFAEEETAVKVLRNTLRTATRRSRKEQYERYLHLWAFRIAIENIRPAHSLFLSESVASQKVPFDCLSLEEKITLFLHDRAHLSAEEISGVLQVQLGKVGRLLTYAREKAARELLGATWPSHETLALRERVALNQNLDSNHASAPKNYLAVMRQVQVMVRELPAHGFAEIESSIRSQQLLPMLGRSTGVRWQDLSWQYKLGLEASFLGVVGLLAVVVLPWGFSRVNVNAFVEGRFAQVLEVDSQAQNTPDLPGITTDRLLASAEGEGEGSTVAEADEFAGMEFPSGDGYEAGSAPLAPSRQGAAVYRLIVQSPSPQELIPHVRALFAQKNVRERENSGRAMPGGVYFDGITSVGNYPQILSEIQNLGQIGTTKTYSNPNAERRPASERARVIVWVQQI